MNEQNMHHDLVEDELDLMDLFHKLVNRKYTILIVFVLAVVLGFVYLYFAKRVYETSALLRIKEKQTAGVGQDLVEKALEGGPAADVDTEIGIIQSFSITQEALKQVPFQVRYFKHTGLKWREVYGGNSPISVSRYQVKNPHFYGKRFELVVQKGNRFVLEVSESLAERAGMGEGVSYSGEHMFGKSIRTPDFVLTLKKNGKVEQGTRFGFTLNTKRSLIERVIQPNLRVTQMGKDASLVKVVYRDTIPRRAQLVTNALANAYIMQTIDENSEEAAKKLSFIDAQLDSLKQKLEESANKVETFKKANGVMDIPNETKAMIDKISTFDQQLAQIEIEEDQARRLNELLQQDNFSAISMTPMLTSDSVIQGLLLSLNQAEQKRKALLVEFTEQHPQVVQQTVQIEKLKGQIRSNLSSFLQGLTERKQSLQQIIDRNEGVFKGLPNIEREYVDLMRSLTVNEKTYSLLLEKQYEVSIMKAATVSGSTVVDPALLPLKPVKPKSMLILAIFSLLGLLAGGGLAMLIEFMDTTIRSMEDVERETSIPQVGAIPFHGKIEDVTRYLKDKPKSSFAEAFRMLRTNLQFMTEYSEHKIIMVTSTVMGEGKTTVALNLATLFAMGDSRCVLLNMDMRRPALQRFFKVKDEEVGLSNYLAGQVGLKNIIFQTDIKNLDVVLSGAVPPNPTELLMNERLATAMEELKKTYDYVILDSPPFGLVADSVVISRVSDILLLLLRMDYSSRGFAAGFEKWAREHGIEKKGIVVNAIEPKKYYYGYNRYGYNYGYRYGYSYGPDGSRKRSIWKRWMKRR